MYQNSRGSSRYRGVKKHKSGKWIAEINISKKQVYLGIFDIEEEAAKAVDAAIMRKKGDWQKLNFPEDWNLPSNMTCRLCQDQKSTDFFPVRYRQDGSSYFFSTCAQCLETRQKVRLDTLRANYSPSPQKP